VPIAVGAVVPAGWRRLSAWGAGAGAKEEGIVEAEVEADWPGRWEEFCAEVGLGWWIGFARWLKFPNWGVWG